MRILHVASEVAPFCKTGGLADVVGALPKAQAELGAQVMVVAPRYRQVDPGRFHLARKLEPLRIELGREKYDLTLFEGTLPGSSVPIYFIDHPDFFDRDGIYGSGAAEHPDNPERFAILGRAAFALCQSLGFAPDIVHGHDWPAGPAFSFAEETQGAGPRPRRVLTVHNAQYQGLYPTDIIERLDLPPNGYKPDGYEFFGQVNFLKMAVCAADAVIAVSPRYTREIQTREGGAGLDGFFRWQSAKLTGILNGIDDQLWNPARDAMIPAPYTAQDLSGKKSCKKELLREFSLNYRAETPLFGFVGRLTPQKGIDLILKLLHDLLQTDVQVVLLGAGEPQLEESLRNLQEQFPQKVGVRIGFDEVLAHRIEAGADFFLMPSLFEPCGLNQLYSLRYGTPPIVRRVGGLSDSIVDVDVPSQTGTGFTFGEYKKEAFEEAVLRALYLFRERPADLDLLRKRCMAQDFSWKLSAKRYMDIYERLLA